MSARRSGIGRWRVRDDAGNPIALQFRRWNGSEAAKDPLTAPILRRARKSVRVSWGTSAAIVVAMCFGFAQSLRYYNPYGWIGAIHFFGCVAGMWGLMTLIGFVASIRRAPRAIQIMKTWRLCPRCAYAIDGLVSKEGLTTYPECGASWRMDERIPA